MQKEHPSMSIQEVFHYIFYEYNQKRYNKLHHFMASRDRWQYAQFSLNLILLYDICLIGFGLSFSCFILEIIFFFVQIFIRKV